MRSESFRLTARYLVPVEGPPIEGGRLIVIDGAIAGIEPARRGPADYDLGNVAVLPGFVNAHTHLDLTPIPTEPDRPDGTENEVRWLRRVVAHRRSTTPEASREAIGRNIASSLASGTTAVADVTPAGRSWDALAGSPLRGIVFAEVVGLSRMRGIETTQAAWDWIASLGINEGDPALRLRPGLSPHAPYSTAGWLYERAAGGKMPLSTHLAEMPEELTLLESRTGPLRRFLEEIGAWDDDWEPVGPSPARATSARANSAAPTGSSPSAPISNPMNSGASGPMATTIAASPSPSAPGPTPGSATPRTRIERCSNAASSSASGRTAWRLLPAWASWTKSASSTDATHP